MKICKLIIMVALGLVLCACAGKQQQSAEPEQPKQNENVATGRIDGASIETVQKEPKIASGYENIVLNPIQTTPQMNTDYPGIANQFQSTTLSYLKDKKMYKRVAVASAKESQPSANTLIVDLKINDLRIVSEGARMWGGVMAGSSYIEVYLKLTDATSKKVIHERTVSTNYNAFASTYGPNTEKSLAVDMGKIIGEYLSVIVPGKAAAATVEKKETTRKKKSK